MSISLPVVPANLSLYDILDVMEQAERKAVVVDVFGEQRLLRFDQLNKNAKKGLFDVYDATEPLTFPLSLTEGPSDLTQIILDISSWEAASFLGGPTVCRCSAGHSALPSENGRRCRRNDGGTIKC